MDHFPPGYNPQEEAGMLGLSMAFAQHLCKQPVQTCELLQRKPSHLGGRGCGAGVSQGTQISTAEYSESQDRDRAGNQEWSLWSPGWP